MKNYTGRAKAADYIGNTKKQDPPKPKGTLKKVVTSYPKVPFKANSSNTTPTFKQSMDAKVSPPMQQKLMKTTQKISPNSLGKSMGSAARESASEATQGMLMKKTIRKK